jgi:hypothetical protein
LVVFSPFHSFPSLVILSFLGRFQIRRYHFLFSQILIYRILKLTIMIFMHPLDRLPTTSEYDLRMHQEFESHRRRRAFDGSNNMLVCYAGFTTLSYSRGLLSTAVRSRPQHFWSVGESHGCITLWIDCGNRIKWCVLDYGWKRQETSSVQTYGVYEWSAFNVFGRPLTY